MASRDVAALFDSLAAEYQRGRERELSFIVQKQRVIEMLGEARGRVLEVGCGPGAMSAELATMGFEVHGIDLSAQMIRCARERMAGQPAQKRCRFAVGDFEHLAFPDAFFDAVVAMGVLEYLPSYGPALRCAARVLKPGGVAVLTVPNRASPYHLARTAQEALRRLRRRRAVPAVAENRCVPWSLDRELRRAGLRKVDSAACNFVLFPLKELQPRLSDALNRALDPIARSRLAPLLGAQYAVKARRA